MGQFRVVLIIFLSLILLTGCGGVHRDYYYSPVSPLSSPNSKPMGKSRSPYYWQIEQESVKVTIFSIKLGSKLIFIIGPAIIIPALWEKPAMKKGALQLRVAIENNEEGHVQFDPRLFTVITKDNKRYLPVKMCGNETNRLVPLELTNKNKWSGCLEYPLDLSEVVPFNLQLDSLIINGKAANIPPIPFVYSKGSHSS